MADEDLRRRRDLFIERVTMERQRRDMSVRQLAAEVQERVPEGTRGASYPGVRALLDPRAKKGILRPRREIVEAIAAVFNVNPAWLTGDGPRDAADAQATARAEDDVAADAPRAPEREVFREVEAVLSARLGPRFDSMSGLFRGSVLELWLRLSRLRDPEGVYGFPPTPAFVTVTAEDLADALRGPAVMLATEEQGSLLHSANAEPYFMAMISALTTLLSIPHPPTPGFGAALMAAGRQFDLPELAGTQAGSTEQSTTTPEANDGDD